ncbi:COP1-interactive protein 1-like [Salvia hispanica]|uniref:COP1-interactive protein 1-like n=1 Tax=Salvia hispanica TaxID=49212 RepID=UPI002009C7C8|nr:COP1-interactive protein 1-like [Salvia hispanica]
MAKQQRRSKSFCNHIDPDKEEQLKQVKIAVEDKVDSVLKIMNDINHGNKETNLRKKSETIELIQDFNKQYEKLNILYENFREKVNKSVEVEDSPSAQDSDAEPNYWNRNDEVSSGSSRMSGRESQEFETSDIEDTLTSGSEVTKIMTSEPGSPLDILRDLEIQREKAGKTNQMLVEIRDMEAMIAELRIEVSTHHTHKKRLEEQVELKSNEAVQAQDTISGMGAQIMEMEAERREQEDLLSSFRKQFEDDKQLNKTRITEIKTEAEGMELELNSLKHQKSELQEGLLEETKHWSAKVDDLTEQVSFLQEQLETVHSHKEEMMLEIKKKSEEISHYLLQIETLRTELSSSKQRIAQEKESLQVKVHDLESEIESLNSNLEEKISHEASQSSLEREKLEEKVFELQRTIAMRENELSTGQNKLKYLKEGIDILTSKLETSENERTGLQMELEASKNDKKLLQRELDKEKEHKKSQLEKITKANFHNAERKIEEMAVEFRKQFEDQYRILSRRIRVAEQLQAENKEWYRKTRDSCEQDNRDLKVMTDRTATELKNVKDLTVTANELLTMIDSKTLKFKECTAKFQNRILKASRGINSVKQWAATKNKSMSHSKNNLDCLLAQLDDKEAEILASQEKICKLEDKMTKLEKIIEENEDEMQVLTEGKRGAIHQLCIWIDYHRDRSNFYKDLLSEYRRQESILDAL